MGHQGGLPSYWIGQGYGWQYYSVDRKFWRRVQLVDEGGGFVLSSGGGRKRHMCVTKNHHSKNSICLTFF